MPSNSAIIPHKINKIAIKFVSLVKHSQAQFRQEHSLTHWRVPRHLEWCTTYRARNPMRNTASLADRLFVDCLQVHRALAKHPGVHRSSLFESHSGLRACSSFRTLLKLCVLPQSQAPMKHKEKRLADARTSTSRFSEKDCHTSCSLHVLRKLFGQLTNLWFGVLYHIDSQKSICIRADFPFM